MYSDNGGGPCGAKLTGCAPCAPDYEEIIARRREDFIVKEDVKIALENLRGRCGVPHGKEGVYFLALYGDMCLEVMRLEQQITELINEQEAAGAKAGE